MLFWLLSIYIFLCNSQVFPSNWQNNGCIPEEEYLMCVSFDSLRNLHWIRDYLSYINIQIVSTYSNLLPIYTTNSYRIDNTNYRDMNDLSICFYPNIKTPFNTSIHFNIYNTTNNDNTFITSSSIQHINSFNMTTNKSPIQFTQDWDIMNNIHLFDDINISQVIIPRIRFSLWLSSAQCIEITTSKMYFANDYNLNIQMYRINNDNKPIQNTMFVTNKFTIYDSSPSFNSILCLSGYPTNNTQGLIGANFTLNDDTTGRSYSLHTINKQSKNFYVSPKQYVQQQSSAILNELHFAIGNINMRYWQSCELSSNISSNIITTESVSFETFDSVTSDAMHYTILLLSSLLFLSLMCICGGCYTNHRYKGTDPIHYSNVLWCLLSIWDFSSQIMFAAVLILQLTVISNHSNNEYEEYEEFLLMILLISVLSGLLISYLCSLLYLIHYLQIWNDPSAPGVTRHWLELWSWLIIFITMTMGGVSVAVELCNCLIIPIEIFSMHLSHSELVRIRKDRFIHFVLIQDIPILFSILLYIFIFVSPILNNNNNFITTIENLLSIKYMVILNVLCSTLISMSITSIFRFMRRNYSHDNPMAQYQFSFTLFVSDEWQSHWIHSHKKIQKCFKSAFDLRKLSLTIIDQCSESLNAMKIEGRLLKDSKHKSEKVENMANANITRNEMRQIGLDLLSEFKVEFKILSSADIRIDHLTIKPIFGGGEIVYNHRTCVQILCVGFLDCIQAIAHKCCPSYVESPPNRTYGNRAMNIPMKSPTMDKTFDFSNNNKKKSKTMTLTVEKSKENESEISQTSKSNSNLPMITIEQQANHDETEHTLSNNTSSLAPYIEKELSQSISTRNTLKLDQQTLFADVYNINKDAMSLTELKESKEPAAEIINNNDPSVEWHERYKQIKNEIDSKETDQYGYETTRKVTFLSHDEKLKQIAGAAPITFSKSNEIDLYDNNNMHGDDNHNHNEYEYYYDDEVDI